MWDTVLWNHKILVERLSDILFHKINHKNIKSRLSLNKNLKFLCRKQKVSKNMSDDWRKKLEKKRTPQKQNVAISEHRREKSFMWTK